jgi:hypothetical protein
MQGYLRQVQQMFFELISLEEVTVSVEAIDDIAVQGADGSVAVEQMKSVTSNDNPVADRSPVFWKTLYNWLQYALHNDFPIDKTLFRLIVISEKDIADGSIVAEFNSANTIESAKRVLMNAQKGLWGNNEEKKNSIPASYRDYLSAVFDNEHRDTICKLIVKMAVILFEGDYDKKLKEKFNNIPTLFPEFAENLYTDMLGWVTERVVTQCKTGKPAYINKREFDAALSAHQRAYNQNVSIPALSAPIDDAVVSGVVTNPNPDTYIRQLELIEADFTDKCKAASDYLRTKEETIKRADKGLFTLHSMNDYTDRLKRSWSSARTRMRLSVGTEIEKGTLLLSETSEAALSMRLQGADVPSFFGSGNLHALANAPKEKPEIGWHPQYETLLKDGIENE